MRLEVLELVKRAQGRETLLRDVAFVELQRLQMQQLRKRDQVGIVSIGHGRSSDEPRERISLDISTEVTPPVIQLSELRSQSTRKPALPSVHCVLSCLYTGNEIAVTAPRIASTTTTTSAAPDHLAMVHLARMRLKLVEIDRGGCDRLAE